jgi:cytochrome c-type biogenesis protein CcmE
MTRKKLKFVVGPAIVVATLVWIGASAFTDTMAYYQTVSELYAMEDATRGKRMRVMGEVVPGSIEREATVVRFVITEGDQTLPVEYVGTDPLPDTFRDYAEAVADGQYADGVFTATKLQAKCASKYEREVEAGVIPETTRLEVPAPNVENGF